MRLDQWINSAINRYESASTESLHFACYLFDIQAIQGLDVRWLSGEKEIHAGLSKTVQMVKEKIYRKQIFLNFVFFFSATNPNNWHWTEKNATQWSKDKLKELLVGLKIENSEWTCEIKELKRCEGEASANNRKAKLVFLVIN